MALGTPVEADTSNSCIGGAQHDVFCPWQTIIDAGGATVQDAATITNPDTNITASTRHIYQKNQNSPSLGRFLQARLRYDDGISAATSPIVVCFGRAKDGVAWTPIKTRGGDRTATLTIDQTYDVQDGTYGYTTPDASDSTWETTGFDEFILGIETAFAATGTTTTALIQARTFG